MGGNYKRECKMKARKRIRHSRRKRQRAKVENIRRRRSMKRRK
jgi:hypothetical protein